MVFSYGVSSANRLLGVLEAKNFLAVFDLEANAVSLVGLRVEDGNVGSVQWRFFLDDTALNARHRVRLGMALHQVDPTNDQTVVSENLEHLRSEEHTSELQSRENLVCRLLLEKKKKKSTH